MISQLIYCNPSNLSNNQGNSVDISDHMAYTYDLSITDLVDMPYFLFYSGFNIVAHPPLLT